MGWLLLVSLVWAFSFGLIKGRLTGIDASLVAFLRLLLAMLVFAPFVRMRGLRTRHVVTLMAIGAVQFGFMYATYIAAFAHLAAYEVASLSIFTPLFVCMVNDAFERRSSIQPYLATILATAGAAIVLMQRPFSAESWSGVILMQVSNLCFALGQVAYARWKRANPQLLDGHVFFFPYLGAAVVTAIAAAGDFASVASINREQWLTLLYLGVIASGFGFFAWNYGATRSSTASLAVMNNAKIPLAVACSLLFFGEQADITRLLGGGGLIVAAGVLAEWRRPSRPLSRKAQRRE